MIRRIAHMLLGLALAGSAVTVATVTTAAPAQAIDCTVAWDTGGNQLRSNVFKNDGTALRKGPGDTCALISTYPAWSDARYHCDYFNTNFVLWSHLLLTNWSQNGWVKFSALKDLNTTTYFC